MATYFEKDGELWIREKNGAERPAGETAQPSAEVTLEQKVAELQQVVDTILTGGAS